MGIRYQVCVFEEYCALCYYSGDSLLEALKTVWKHRKAIRIELSWWPDRD